MFIFHSKRKPTFIPLLQTQCLCRGQQNTMHWQCKMLGQSFSWNFSSILYEHTPESFSWNFSSVLWAYTNSWYCNVYGVIYLVSDIWRFLFIVCFISVLRMETIKRVRVWNPLSSLTSHFLCLSQIKDFWFWISYVVVISMFNDCSFIDVGEIDDLHNL